MKSNLFCDVSKSRSFSWEWMTMLMHKVKWISGHWSILLFFSVRCFGPQIIYVNTLSILILQKRQVMLAAYQIQLWLDRVSSSVRKWLSVWCMCVHCGARIFNVYFRNDGSFVSVSNPQLWATAIGRRRLVIPCCLRGASLCSYWFQGWDQVGRCHVPSCKPQSSHF